ncbi:MAG: presqualene diphosphate synthase HpnD [Rhodocyclaceae bacterium]|nr:presqualene diphosphate synthase HpnD [Rhodocyclaceae bacterium]
MNVHDYCQQKVAESGTSFYYAFLFLPTEKRQAIHALYAFCREVDDVVDECEDPAVAVAKLSWWRQEVAMLESGQPTHPVMIALKAVRDRFSLPLEYFNEIIDGMAMDLEHSRYPDFKSLSLYCYRVAGVVGLLSAEIFGVSDRKTLRYATELGTALQLTNIIRDVGEDARRGRIYIPVDELQQFNVPASDIMNARETPEFQALMAFQAERAQGYYTSALNTLPAADRSAQRPGLIMAAVYRTLLDEITKDGFQVLKQKTALPPLRKLWIALKTWFKY